VPYDPTAQDLTATLRSPSLAHPLGTDNFGRDVLSRIVWGTRLDLAMGLLALVTPFVTGCLIGLISGYFGGIVDILLMRLLDVTMSFPFFVLVIAIISVLGPGLASFFIAVALVAWVSYARLVRSRVLILKHADFVLAARSLGYGHLRVMLRHILPNAVLPAVVFSMWGVMIAEGQNFLATAWWICFFPGLAIVFVALGFSLLADGLAERFGTGE
jgi:peptide/nickel transport system permease protein